MLVRLRLQSGLRLNPVRNLESLCSSARSDPIPIAGSSTFRSGRVPPAVTFAKPGLSDSMSAVFHDRPHFLGRFLVHDHRSRNEIPQPAALPVAHHADQAHAVDSRKHIDRTHQVSSHCLERIDRPARSP